MFQNTHKKVISVIPKFPGTSFFFMFMTKLTAVMPHTKEIIERMKWFCSKVAAFSAVLENKARPV